MNYISIDHLSFAYLRTEFSDFIYDFPQMALAAMSIWGDHMHPDDKEGIRYGLEECRKLNVVVPTHINRIYVTTEYVYPSLVLADTSQTIVDHMLSVLDEIPNPDIRYKDYLDCIVLWYFYGNHLVKHMPVTPTAFAELLLAFDRENLVSAEYSRRRWNWESEEVHP